MKNPIDAVVRGYERTLATVRARSVAFDHFWRAKERYGDVLGGRLAAAIAYYAFFAAFALALVAYSILGYALSSRTDLRGSVSDYLRGNLPWLEVDQISGSRTPVAVLGFIGLILTGVGWVDSMRSSQRLIWKLEQQPGNVFVRWLVDLATLAGLGVLVALSLWVAGGIERLLLWIAPGYLTPLMQDVLSWIGVVLGWLVNLLLAAALLAGVPRVRMAPGRLLPPAILVSLGLSLLTTFGQFIFDRTRENPAYQVAGSVAGLLVFLYLFNQLLLFGASVAATSTVGRVLDLAAGPPAAADPEADGGARDPASGSANDQKG